AGHKKLDDALGLGPVMEAAIELGMAFAERFLGGKKAVPAQKVTQSNPTEPAAAMPEKAPALDSLGIHRRSQSMKTNSLALNSNRQALASPCLAAYASSTARSCTVGRRARASRYAPSICAPGS